MGHARAVATATDPEALTREIIAQGLLGPPGGGAGAAREGEAWSRTDIERRARATRAGRSTPTSRRWSANSATSSASRSRSPTKARAARSRYIIRASSSSTWSASGFRASRSSARLRALRAIASSSSPSASRSRRVTEQQVALERPRALGNGREIARSPPSPASLDGRFIFPEQGLADRRHDGVDTLAAFDPGPARGEHQDPPLKRANRGNRFRPAGGSRATSRPLRRFRRAAPDRRGEENRLRRSPRPPRLPPHARAPWANGAMRRRKARASQAPAQRPPGHCRKPRRPGPLRAG